MTGLLSACQPPTATENSEKVNSSIIISEDSVTMAPEYILSIKTLRYQPSLGLQGIIEPIKQARLSAAQDLHIEEVLVTNGQWVEKGAPLLIVQRPTVGDSVIVENDNDNDQSPQKTENSLSEPVTNPASNKRIDDSKQINDQIVQDDLTPVTLIDTEQLITIRASFAGRVDNLYVGTTQNVKAHEPLMRLSDDTALRFIATLPIQAKSQLSVGQTVNFTAAGQIDTFTGQVSKLTVNRPSNQLLVDVHVVKNDVSRGKLPLNTAVSGRVDYGQIEVGTIVPAHGIHDVDLTELQKPPYKPSSPLTANVWTIKQDQRLTRQSVEVIEYDPSTKQYLIAGISNDSLICLADLPLESAGKKVVIL
ncbi:HlyD family efflux transporter periplasmic adaptor subunit [Psychrobacter urativorans]|uniref:Uncharacterized protein n=1 Tax=Psychrobacter urativorans TaxID=45610 RepID=A0A0M4SZS6_9GAMM|nr:HlyD family efflux transporter periplasmic adaptor subunit [Psychrobacter urativorans]ALF60748.1 hypothetical protein AOC03_04590 [Psychrobacter urativorans]